MSTLVVQVRTVDKIEDHPNGQRLKIATVGGWKTCISYNPETGIAQFEVGEKCVFFPPDSVLPESLANGPNDSPPGRLGIKAYLKALPKEENGNRPTGGRVAAQRLRNTPSFGVIMKIDPKYGDDPNWEVGTDLKEYYGITKYEPVLTATDIDAEIPNVRFHSYTGIEHFSNFPTAFENLDDVIYTEKIHGKNCRFGLILDTDETGEAYWNFMAGSNDTRRKEFFPVRQKFRLDELANQGIHLDPVVIQSKLTNNEIIRFELNHKYWQVNEVVVPREVVAEEGTEIELPIWRIKCFEVANDGSPVYKKSQFWEVFSLEAKKLLEYLAKEYEWHEQKYSVILFGEIFGSSIQDMTYGLIGIDFRAFDIAINNRYLDFDIKSALFSQFGVVQVPTLYRGPFSKEKMEELTSGPTTLCNAKQAGKFKGREGIVITPAKEVDYCPIMNGRKIAKSVSADYLARQDGTEFH